MAGEVFLSCSASRSFHQSLFTRVSNLDAFARLGFKLLFAGEWATLQTDKDGGYDLLPRSVLRKAFSDILAGGSYLRYPWHGSPEVVMEYVCISKVIAELYDNDDGLFNALLSYLRSFGVGGLVSRPGKTLLSQKAAGKVTLRASHCSVHHPLLPAMRWVSAEIRKGLAYGSERIIQKPE